MCYPCCIYTPETWSKMSWLEGDRYVHGWIWKRTGKCLGKMVVLLGWRAPSCLTPCWSPLEGDIPNKYPLCKVYMGLILQGIIPRVQPFSLWSCSSDHKYQHFFQFKYLSVLIAPSMINRHYLSSIWHSFEVYVHNFTQHFHNRIDFQNNTGVQCFGMRNHEHKKWVSIC